MGTQTIIIATVFTHCSTKGKRSIHWPHVIIIIPLLLVGCSRAHILKGNQQPFMSDVKTMSDIKSDRQWMSGGAHQEIITVGDPLLRRQSEMVKDIGQATLLGERMASLLRELKGAGLAAPQIGVSERIVVVEVRQTDLFPDRPESPLYVMINPAIVEASEDLEEWWEGCFSVPGLMGQVPRHKSITVQYTTPDASTHRETFNGYIARVIQHEYDHLEGKIFLDRMTSTNSLTTVANYIRFHHKSL